MAVTLRLSRHGQTKRPFYRIVATEKASRRDGKFIEIVGTLNTMTEPQTINLKEERVKHWISVGALPSSVVKRLIMKQIPNLIEEKEAHQVKKIQAARKKRKERAAARAK